MVLPNANGTGNTKVRFAAFVLSRGETSSLFKGAEREAEQAILNRGVDLSATVLKVGHHESDTSTSYV